MASYNWMNINYKKEQTMLAVFGHVFLSPKQREKRK